ncbi:TonB-dependent hemoglobin/transferrin/lactoferrin family receptor [Laribacter hongkongensis]|uniref:TonB-dependent hemoglobin/transferrin/lactoferrin family receptor n=1 Tax=Laribacter hongkongensis TaxID=168471 RepID=UPI001EFC567D|nr:TonB-dependent hemoglobin/transferrin/lactoferrin family receptor [Laribacter hongkongensis]MCG8999689.1 TonB-dependent hemoglobin/transferrin/lactoferrin family receptor [Laribacter hongkongensis]MCG9004165.1 TonB-dependent hemoglobin/transferrin/lactoferrin family receptor [Laribacter hongkongensis]MCG9013454.1 TonB-dependent hemoglobin/transferrin/lactoferrin family receptor [Laribacter hongkongensis]MCG9019134.1 TonB-dependent hemoglobin/transferrin/lactoferrin family receptor [Laribacte
MAVPRLAPLVLSLAAAFPVLAEELPSLEAVEVTAHRTDKSLAQTAPNAVVISRHKLDATLAEDMADAVKYEPGVDVASDPARRGNAGYTIRGIDGNRILMLVDGIRLPDAYAGGGNTNGFVSGRDYIDLDSLRAIDIVKGPFSSLYGSDAIGGVVGYRTLEVDDIVMPDERFGGGIKVFGASADQSAGLTARLGVKGDTADAMLLVTRRNGHETGNQGHNDTRDTSRTTPNPQDWSSDNVLAKVGFAPAANQRLELVFDHYRRQTDTDVISSQSSSITRMLANDTVRRDRLSLGWQARELGIFDKVALKLYTQKLDNSDDSTEWRSNGARRLSDYGFRQTSHGLTFDARHQLDRGGLVHQLVWGVDASRTDTSRPRDKVEIRADGSTSHVVAGETYPSKTFPDSTSDRLGLFVQDEIRFANGIVASPSLRWDYYRMRAEVDQAYLNANPAGGVPSFSDSAFSPKFGLSIPFAGHYTGFVQLSTGFRAPPFDDANMVYANQTYGYEVIANPNLRSETSQGIELGLKGAWDHLDFGITAYANRYRDFIELVELTGDSNGNGIGSPGRPGSFESQYQNIGRVTIHGLEAKSTWRLAPGWRLTGSLAWAQGNNQTDDRPLDSVAPFTAVAGLRYDSQDWGAEAFVKAVSQKKRVSNDSTFKVPGYATLDLTAYWSPVRNHMLRVGVFNVFDRTYWNAADVRGLASTDRVLARFTRPGRNVSASYELTF